MKDLNMPELGMHLSKLSIWLDETIPKHKQLTKAVVTIIENLLKSEDIDYLAVTGRTKDKQGALDKSKRKGYKNPLSQLTDLSGIRVIVYLESDVEKVSTLINKSFNVDEDNSLNQDELLSTDRIGYRSVHYVCDLGTQRSGLPEFEGLSGLKFEFQVRTVLQHAWAELSHDRNYQFSGKLPKVIERQLFLYAGMLEIADKGFDELSKQIDDYAARVREETIKGNFSTEINSLSLEGFVEDWSRRNRIELGNLYRESFEELISELKQFGITTLRELKNIIPENYAKTVKERNRNSRTVSELIREWMLISDWRKFYRNVHFDWDILLDGGEVFDAYLDSDELNNLYKAFSAVDIDEIL